MTSTFWGLRLEAGKRYSTIVDKSFHVSMAALDCTTVKSEKEVHSVMLEEGESNIPFILCNLHKPKVTQCPLNLNFISGDRVTFFCRGNGTVHLTGYLMIEDDFGAFGEEEIEEEEDEDVDEEEDEEGVEDEDMETVKEKSKVNGLLGKRKAEQLKGHQKKQPKLDESEQEEEDEDEDDEEGESASDLDSEDNALIGPDESEEDEPVSEEESEEEPEEPPQQQQKKNKKQKIQPQSPSQQKQQKQSPGQVKQQQANGTLQQKKKQANEEKPAMTAPGKKTLSGGVIVKDIKLGTGAMCKPGKMVSVYYVGRLKSNNKVFDKLSQGKGFKFRLGKDEVIKGWDIGLAGMKVGGKRLITCPPEVAYGEEGSPPTIPPKSTLLFEVELKSVF